MEASIETLKALTRCKHRLIELGGLKVVIMPDGTSVYELVIKPSAWHAVFLTKECNDAGIDPHPNSTTENQ